MFLYFFTIFFVLFIGFITGFFINNFFQIKFSTKLHGLMMIPIHFSAGISFLIIVLSLISFICIDKKIAYILVLFIFFLYCTYACKKINFKFTEQIKITIYLQDVIFILLFIFNYLLFTRLALFMNFPMAGDMYFNGKYTSVILFLKKIPILNSFDYIDFFIYRNYYSPGFNVLGAFFSYFVNLFPIQILLCIAVSLIIMIPLLLYSIIYSMTNSIYLSIIAYCLTFFLPGGKPLMWKASHDVLLGNFLRGGYSTLLGVFLYVTIMGLYLNINDKNSYLKKSYLFLMILSLGISYYVFIPYLFMSFMLIYLIDYKYKLHYKINKIIVLFINILVYFLIILKKENILKYLDIDVTLNYYKFIDNYDLLNIKSIYLPYTIILIISFLLNIYLIKKYIKYKNIMLFYLTLFFSTFFCLNKNFYEQYIWFLKPDRFFIITIIVSYIILIITINEIIQNVKNKLAPNLLKKIIFIIALLLLIPSFLGHFLTPNKYLENIYAPTNNDLQAFKWMSKNIESDELILNDRTMVGLWLPSCKILNVINERDLLREIYLFKSINNTFIANRTIEANQILSRPKEYEKSIEIINKYNITHIYISESQIPFLNLGRDVILEEFLWPNNMSQLQRINFYKQNPILDVAFHSGNAYIFKVKRNY